MRFRQSYDDVAVVGAGQTYGCLDSCFPSSSAVSFDRSASGVTSDQIVNSSCIHERSRNLSA